MMQCINAFETMRCSLMMFKTQGCLSSWRWRQWSWMKAVSIKALMKASLSIKTYVCTMKWEVDKVIDNMRWLLFISCSVNDDAEFFTIFCDLWMWLCSETILFSAFQWHQCCLETVSEFIASLILSKDIQSVSASHSYNTLT